MTNVTYAQFKGSFRKTTLLLYKQVNVDPN